MYDIDAIDRKAAATGDFDKFRKQRGGDFKFKFLQPKHLEDGQYWIRLLPPHSTRNPDGVMLQSTHTIEMVGDSDEDKKKNHTFLSPLSIEDPRKQCHTIMEMLAYINEEGLFEQMDEAHQRVVGHLSPWNRWWVVLLLWAEDLTPVGPDGKRSYEGKYVPVHDPAAKPLGRILELDAKTKMWDDLKAILKTYPNISHKSLGQPILLKKNHTSYDFLPHPTPTPIPPELYAEFVNDNDYPDLRKIRDKRYKAPSDIMSWLRKAWWAPDFAQMYDIDLFN